MINPVIRFQANPYSIRNHSFQKSLLGEKVLWTPNREHGGELNKNQKASEGSKKGRAIADPALVCC